MTENLMCPAHKAANEKFRENWDSTFLSGKNILMLRKKGEERSEQKEAALASSFGEISRKLWRSCLRKAHEEDKKREIVYGSDTETGRRTIKL